jgi:hypothetical protein
MEDSTSVNSRSGNLIIVAVAMIVLAMDSSEERRFS